MRISVLSVLSVLSLVAAAPAGAACRWEWTCDGAGNCQQVPLCSNAIDLVPPRPPSVRPIAPPSIRPIQRPVVPPIGTTKCGPVQVKGPYGWRWETVCR